MKTFDKLKVRIKKDLDIDAFKFERRRVGYWQRSAGAWLWVANKLNEDGTPSAHDIGSTFSATDLLAYKGKLVIDSKGEIMPDN